ncbi:unnamed protein product, partial [Coregonus sp. 'balchen']
MNKQNAKLQRRRRREEEEEEERRAQEEVERFSEEEKHRGLQESRELLYPSHSCLGPTLTLEREEVLLRRQAQLGVTSFSTGTGVVRPVRLRVLYQYSAVGSSH